MTKAKKKLPRMYETIRSLTPLAGVVGGVDGGQVNVPADKSSKRCEFVLTA